MRASSSRITSAELRAAREFLRQLRCPAWSGEMPIPDPIIQESFHAALRELTPRARRIIERTELDDQRVADVAKSLGISERQLYRDRASALRAIAKHIPSLRTPVARPNVQIRDSREMRRAHARILTQVGQLESAGQVLRALAQETSDPREKVTTYCALTRLALEQGSLKDARQYADCAISSTFLCSDDSASRYEVDSILGEIALRHGRPDTASQMLRHSIMGLRALLGDQRHDHIAASLAQSLLSLAVSQHGAGRASWARDAVYEARSRLNEMSRPDYILDLDARVLIAATAHFLGEDAARAESELRVCYDISLNRGLILNALDISVYLATFYRLRGSSHQGLQLMKSLASVCNGLSASRTKAFFYLAFASLLCSIGDADLAGEMVKLAHDATVPDQLDIEAQLHLATTRTKLAAGSPFEALDSSAKAAVIFTELGRTALLGVSLHLRSLALLAVGRRRESLRAACDAVEILSGSHPHAHWLAKRTLAALRSHAVKSPHALIAETLGRPNPSAG